jgi:hypothetical protein
VMAGAVHRQLVSGHVTYGATAVHRFLLIEANL